MRFSEYRSRANVGVWDKVREKDHTFNRDFVLKHPRFSTWDWDDCCAINWKNNNPIKMCIVALYSYIIDDVLLNAESKTN